jgi:hypothetical protein
VCPFLFSALGLAPRSAKLISPSVALRTMVLADRMLFVAGPPDLVDEEQAAVHLTDAELQAKRAEQAAAMAGKRGGLLLAVSAANGEKLGEYQLDAPPVFDGMIAARGRLYLAAADGTLVCLGGK